LPKLDPVANVYEATKLEYFFEIDGAMQRQWDLVGLKAEIQEWDTLWAWVFLDNSKILNF
jgi:hypothetical protein